MPGPLRFEWDFLKAQSNLAKHGISFEEAVTVFGDSLAQIIDDRHHSIGERRYVLLGQSDRGRLLVLLFTERGGAIRLISARRATPRERRRHEEGEG